MPSIVSEDEVEVRSEKCPSRATPVRTTIIDPEERRKKV